jgi:LCP family protein required for cell wall assembly
MTKNSDYNYENQVTGAPWLKHAKQPLPNDTNTNNPKRHFSFKRGIKRTFILVLVCLIAFGSFMGWELYNNASKLTGDKNPVSLLGDLLPSSLKETNGRVNILLAGYSADDPGHQGADLTDSIMIVSIDTTNKTATLISVPRDLYVNIPGYGYSKINAAYEDGQSESFSESGYASGGMGLLEKTIGTDFGVQFDYEGLINYEAFKDSVNAVGGVSVDIQSDDARGLYDPNTNLNLPNGVVNLNGQEALDLARARGDGYGSYGFPNGDFNRTQHQQQLLVALKNKISSGSVISNPLKIAKLANGIGNNIKTDMTVGDMETLYEKTKGISDNNIKEVTLNSYDGTDYLTDYETNSGQDALVPTAGIGNYSQIQELMQNLLG